MQIMDRKFTVYSGTVLENLNDCTHKEGENIIYRKSYKRFSYPEGVYFSSKIEEAAWYALIRAKDLERSGWSHTEEFLSDHYKKPRTDRYTPVIMCGEVGIARRFFNRIFPIINFPINSVLVLEEGMHAHEALYGRKRSDWLSLFHQFDLRELLK